jgi:hypothetical protein
MMMMELTSASWPGAAGPLPWSLSRRRWPTWWFCWRRGSVRGGWRASRGSAAGDTGYAVFERSSAGRSTCTLDRAGNSNDDPESRDGDIIGAKKISSSGWLRRRAWKAGSPKRPQQQRLRMRMRMRMR